MRMPGFAPRSMLEASVVGLKLSSKFHAELAGKGIEYDFGRSKWWFRNYNSPPTAGLRAKYLISFGADVITLTHTRKVTRRFEGL